MDRFPQPPRFKKLVTPPVFQPITAENKNKDPNSRLNQNGSTKESGNEAHPSSTKTNPPGKDKK